VPPLLISHSVLPKRSSESYEARYGRHRSSGGLRDSTHGQLASDLVRLAQWDAIHPRSAERT